MNKPLAIGLIILFILAIAGSAIWLTIRPEETTEVESEVGILRRFPLNIFGLGGEEPTTAGETTPAEGQVEKPALVLLRPGPIVSFVPTEKGVRFLEQETGHVSEVGPEGEDEVLISNTTIPGIFDALFTPDASGALLKYMEGETLRAVSTQFVATSTKATVLPQNIISAAYALDSKRISYLIPSGDNSRTIAANPDNSKQSEINLLPFKEFEIFWPEKNSFYYLSRPSGVSDGFLFKYSVQNGSLDKILGDVPGLEVKFSKDASKFVYSSFDSNSSEPRLWTRNLKTGEVVSMQTRGLARKCAFSSADINLIYCALDQNLPSGIYPDDWLQGVIGSNDSIWEINLETGAKKLLNADRTFDISQIDVSRNGGYLYFIDRRGNSLWSLKLK